VSPIDKGYANALRTTIRSYTRKDYLLKFSQMAFWSLQNYWFRSGQVFDINTWLIDRFWWFIKYLHWAKNRPLHLQLVVSYCSPVFDIKVPGKERHLVTYFWTLSILWKPCPVVGSPIPLLASPIPLLGMKAKQGKSVVRLYLKISLIIVIESSRQDTSLIYLLICIYL